MATLTDPRSATAGRHPETEVDGHDPKPSETKLPHCGCTAEAVWQYGHRPTCPGDN